MTHPALSWCPSPFSGTLFNRVTALSLACQHSGIPLLYALWFYQESARLSVKKRVSASFIPGAGMKDAVYGIGTF